jgi:hypothetical protein
MKKLKIKGAIFFTDKDESIKNEIIFLDDDIKIDNLLALNERFNFIDLENPNSKDESCFYWKPNPTNDESLDVGYFTTNELLDKAVTSLDIKPLNPRIATIDEIKILENYWLKEHILSTREEIINDLKESIQIVFDVTDDFKILISSSCQIVMYSDGTKRVENIEFKYAIKYGFIYPYDDIGDFGEVQDDIEEDISSITSILKNK